MLNYFEFYIINLVIVIVFRSYAEILRRQNKLKELTLKLKMLAEPLQKTPITFPKDRVPTEADLKRLSLEVSKLEKEHEDVKNSFNDLQIKVKKILQELNIEMRPQFENIILISNLPVSICKANFSCLKKYYDELRHWQQNQEYKVNHRNQNIKTVTCL